MRIASARARAFLVTLSTLLFLFGNSVIPGANSITTSSSSAALRCHFISELQSSCLTPNDVIDRVGQFVTPTLDPSGELARLVLGRLSKLWIALDNQRIAAGPTTTGVRSQTWKTDHELTGSRTEKNLGVLSAVVASLLQSTSQGRLNAGNLVEGTKSYSVISRLIPWASDDVVQSFWNDYADNAMPYLQEHEISGVYWAMENMIYSTNSASSSQCQKLESKVPGAIRSAWIDLNLPFLISPGLLSHFSSLSVENLCEEVDFRVDQIRTKSKKFVPERRETSWQGDVGVVPFLYGGKEMPREEWAPTVLCVRDYLSSPQTGHHHQYFDCALINHYPCGESAMRYHSDPDQGVLWDFDTAVVSVGATRRFAFRPVPSTVKDRSNSKGTDGRGHHTFTIMHGDVTHMFHECQKQYQHCVKKAETKADDSARISLVFKRSLGLKQVMTS